LVGSFGCCCESRLCVERGEFEQLDDLSFEVVEVGAGEEATLLEQSNWALAAEGRTAAHLGELALGLLVLRLLRKGGTGPGV